MIDMTMANIANRNYRRRQREIKRRKALSCCAITVGIISVIMLLGSKPADYTYAVASENNPGYAYEYVTDRVCTVTEINGNIITVETRDGNLYEFYGNGYKVGTEIICTFNSADELINTK